MKKRTIALVVFLSLIVVFVAWKPNAQSKTKIYYSGEAVTFNNKLVFATVNTGALELFTLENDGIVRTVTFKPKFVRLPRGSENFHDLEFDISNGKLYLYLINGRYLYKYDVSNPYAPKLLEKIKDNAWDWFLQLDKIDGYLVTIGTKNIKLWNNDLQVVNSYNVDYAKAENVFVAKDGKYIFSLVDNVIEVYDTDSREIKSNVWLDSKGESLRGLYYDSFKNEIYITDDVALKVFNLDGKELRRFNHTSDHGYDVEPSNINSSVYFSDGIGVVRNNKSNLDPVDWKYTTGLGSGDGWAMDIEVVSDNRGDKMVIFNKSEILVLDNNLELVDFFRASDIDDAPIEALNIKLDKSSGFPGDYLTVSGGGFGMNEELSITMNGEKWTTGSDSNGRFKRTIEVVDIKPQITDIKVDGLSSGLSYSISFKIN